MDNLTALNNSIALKQVNMECILETAPLTWLRNTPLLSINGSALNLLDKNAVWDVGCHAICGMAECVRTFLLHVRPIGMY